MKSKTKAKNEKEVKNINRNPYRIGFNRSKKYEYGKKLLQREQRNQARIREQKRIKRCTSMGINPYWRD
jgi:hypothetical protein